MGEKMWAVFSLLMNSEECISAEDIQHQLEEKGYDIGLKAVYAVIKQINVFTSLMFGKEIIKAVRRFGYMIETGYFDEAQIQLLIDMVNYRQDLTNNDKREIVNKLLKLSPARQKDYLIVPELEDDDEGVYSLSKNLKIITSAIRNKKDIRFQYVDYSIRDGHPVETYSTKGNAGINHEYYNVSPYNTVIVDGHYYLRAYYNKHKNSFFDGDEITLHIKFDGVLIREVVSRLGKDITINKTIAPIENDHQWYETRVEGIIFNTGLMNWIRQFGPMIIVVGPEKLKEAITDGLEENLSYYKK